MFIGPIFLNTYVNLFVQEKEPEEQPKKEEKKKRRERKEPDRKERVKEYFKTEINRLKESLQKEADKIEKPPR